MSASQTEKVYGGVSRILGENAVNTDIVTIFIDIICTVWEGMIGAYLFRTYATKLIPWKKDVLWVCFFVLLAETLTFSPISSIIKIVVELFLCGIYYMPVI